MKPWDLYSVLTQKYCWSSKEAREFADFLIPMLDFDTRRRATAWDCLNHSWIKTEISSPRKTSSDKQSPVKPTATSTSNTANKTSDRYSERKNEKHNKSITREPHPDTVLNGSSGSQYSNETSSTSSSAKYSSKSDHSSDHEILIVEKSNR